jgi:glucosamine-6-phosphate deaminase
MFVRPRGNPLAINKAHVDDKQAKEPSMVTRCWVDTLAIHVHADRHSLAAAAAADCAQTIREAVDRRGWAKVLFASAPSQNEFLAALTQAERVPWQQVVALQLDEYVGLGADHPASFSHYLRERLPGSLATFHRIQGDASDLKAECRRYADLLTESTIDVCCLGIGENGHLAFNEPTVADFDDPELVKTVHLETESRQQQVNDGCFPDLAAVPAFAVTITLPAILSAERVICVVPGASKAAAVRRAVTGAISPQCPASVLRKHPAATLYLDRESAQLFTQDMSECSVIG